MPKRKPPSEPKEKPKSKSFAAKKPRVTEEICKSKVLASKLKDKSRSITNNSKKNKEPRLFGNGKPMPSLAELERMYADSDEDEEAKTEPSRPKTPIPNHQNNKHVVVSPTKLKEIADKVLDVLEVVLPDPVTVFDDEPPQPIVLPRKRKKNGVPYIVGCTERPKIDKKPVLSCFKGEEEYGVKKRNNDNEVEEDDECSKTKQRQKRGEKKKSIFNAKSDDIAAMLKNAESDGSSNDSTKTVAYQLYNPIERFSPIPSTSNDNITIQKNEELFNKSVGPVKLSNSNKEDRCLGNEIELIETPIETIEINDNAMTNVQTKRDLDFIEDPDSPIQIIECNNEIKKVDSPINVDDCYGSIDLDFSYHDNTPDNITDEIIDVDAIIAENQEIIQKISEKSKSSKPVIHIAANEKFEPKVDNAVQDMSEAGPSTILQPTTETNTKAPSEIETIVTNFFNTSNSSSTYTPDSSNMSPPTANVPQINATSTPNPNIHLVTNQEPIDLTEWTPVKDFSQKLGSDIRNWLSTVTPPRNFPCGNQRSFQQPTVTDYVVLSDSCQSPYANNGSANNSVQIVSATNSNNRPNPNIDDSVQILTSPAVLVSRNPAETQTCSSMMGSSVSHHGGTGGVLRGFSIVTPFASGPLSQVGLPRAPKVRKPRKSKTTTSVEPPLTPPPSSSNEKPTNSPEARGMGDCPICMDKLTRNAIVSTLCGHLFCMDCMKAAIRTNGKKCPTCRKALKGVGYHQIFI